MNPVGVAITVLRNRRALKLLLVLAAALLFALLVIVAAVVGVIEALLAAQEEQEGQCPTGQDYDLVSQEPSEAALADIPENYLEAYRAAGEEYGIDWAVIAAVGAQESNHGREGADGDCIIGDPTPYGNAKGPMQFLDGTWEIMGVDGNGDGEANPCDYEDAIPSAARYLVDLGAPEDYRGALCGYYGACGDEHADYANEVLAQADAYRAAEGEEPADNGDGGEEEMAAIGSDALRTGPKELEPELELELLAQEGEPGAGAGGEAVFPTPESYMDSYSNDWGADRPQGSHEGNDIMAPNGEPLYAMVDGTIQQTAGSSSSNWSEMGGWNIMLEADYDVGPIRAGDLLYYAHMDEPPPVSEGQRVEAGEVIGAIGDTGYGPEGTRGQFPPHLHLGWYDQTGSREEAASGAMNPYPLLEWLKENGGTATGTTPTGGGAPLARGDCAPGATPTSGPGGGGGSEEAGSGEAGELIDDPNVVLHPPAEGDLIEGIVDERLIAALQAIARNQKIEIRWFKTDHILAPGVPEGPVIPEGYPGAGAPNTHYHGRAADIIVVNDRDILGRGTDDDVLDIGHTLQGLGPQERPDAMIGPPEWHDALGSTRETGFIQGAEDQELHRAHLHLGYMQESGTMNSE